MPGVHRAIRMKLKKMETAPKGDYPWFSEWPIQVRNTHYCAGRIGLQGIPAGPSDAFGEIRAASQNSPVAPARWHNAWARRRLGQRGRQRIKHGAPRDSKPSGIAVEPFPFVLCFATGLIPNLYRVHSAAQFPSA